MAQVVGIPGQCGVNMLATAFIVKEKSSNVAEDEIRTNIKSHFSEPHWLHGGVHFMDSFPTTVSGKVSKRLLKDWLMERKQ